MERWYVYFISPNTKQKTCHCFEDDEKQARHFANLVSGIVCRNNEKPDWNMVEKRI